MQETAWYFCYNLDFLKYNSFNMFLFFKTHLQDSLRDPNREGVDDNHLRQLIRPAMHFIISYAQFFLFFYFAFICKFLWWHVRMIYILVKRKKGSHARMFDITKTPEQLYILVVSFPFLPSSKFLIQAIFFFWF